MEGENEIRNNLLCGKKKEKAFMKGNVLISAPFLDTDFFFR